MDIRINKNDKVVEWNVGERVLTIHNEYVLFAFKHGKNMLMIKEKYESLEKGVSTYDKDGKIVFSYKCFGNQIDFREKSIFGINGSIISADYEEEKRKLVILIESEEKRMIQIFNDNADLLAEINSPKDYLFVSLKNHEGNIMVVAQGTNDSTKDSYGRNDWIFSIDFDFFYVERKSITQ